MRGRCFLLGGEHHSASGNACGQLHPMVVGRVLTGAENRRLEVRELTGTRQSLRPACSLWKQVPEAQSIFKEVEREDQPGGLPVESSGSLFAPGLRGRGDDGMFLL